MTKRLVGFILLFAGLAGLALSVPSLAEIGDTERVSVSTDGLEGEAMTRNSSISADGRFVAFDSGSRNLVSDDTTHAVDVFVRDRQTGVTTRVSLSSEGLEGNQSSGGPAISADGRYVAFISRATNLVPDDTNGWDDVFVHDRRSGVTTRVNLSSEGMESDSGSTVNDASISAEGRFVAFISDATNLVPNDTNGAFDVFVHDRQTGETARVSLSSEGVEANAGSGDAAISADGRYVAFISWATNLVPEDTNGWDDVFVHDRDTGQTTRVSVSSEGAQSTFDGPPSFRRPPDSVSISGDGRFVAFTSSANNLAPNDTNGGGGFVHDRQTGQTTRVFSGSGPSLSARGRFVAFSSSATNLVPDDTNGERDVFVHDRQTGQTTRVSVDSEGQEGDFESFFASLSADGRFVAFASYASNLVPEDTNDTYDVFVHQAKTLDQAEDLLSVSLTLATTSFAPGDTLDVGLEAHSLQPDFIADLYFCVLMPDGQTLAFIVDRLEPAFAVTRLDADARSFVPLYSEVAIPLGLEFRSESFFSYTFSDELPEGGYTLYVALLPPGALEDGVLDVDDLLELATTGFTSRR